MTEFKVRYFKELLRKGFNNDEGYTDAVKVDNSHYGEPILTNEDIYFIDSLTNVGNQIMVEDSIQSYSKRAEGAQGKLVFYYALKKYNSTWLDSISNNRYEIYWKIENDFRENLKE
ncbi:MAG TPA: hypothetical protein PLU58_11910 [Saprospiraceae bacterium]|nr:hypothetical protein [Saprospiraceae bacterium]